jgi:hypothetical protein
VTSAHRILQLFVQPFEGSLIRVSHEGTRGLYRASPGKSRADLVGFAADGAYVSISRADGSSQAEFKAVNDFGSNKGWRLDKHVRVLADINGDDLLDIVGFGDAGVFVALANLDVTYR